MNEYFIGTPNPEDFRVQFKATLNKCRDAECFSVLITPQPGSLDFTLCLQTDANKKAVRGKFHVSQARCFWLARGATNGVSEIGKRRTNEAGIESLCAYIHAVIGGVFCKLAKDPEPILETPLLDMLLLEAPPVMSPVQAPRKDLPPAQSREAKPEQKNTEESE